LAVSRVCDQVARDDISTCPDCKAGNHAAGIGIQPAIDALAINHAKARRARMRATNQRIARAGLGKRQILAETLGSFGPTARFPRP